MKERGHDISDEGGLRKFRTEIPNTVIRGMKSRGLSVQAKWLYVYFKSVCGDSAECYRTTSTIAEESGLSRTMVSNAKRELAAKGLILLTKSKNPNRQADHVCIRNIWDANMQEFSVPLANAVNEESSKEPQEEKEDSVPLANAESEETPQRSISERSVPLANSSVLLANQRRSQEEDPSKNENSPSKASPIPGGGTTGYGVNGTQMHGMYIPTKDLFTPGFMRVWKIYPAKRRDRQRNTAILWRTKQLEPRAEECGAKIERLKITQWAQREAGQIPTFYTWLDEDRYDDELVPLDDENEETTAPDASKTPRQRREDKAIADYERIAYGQDTGHPQLHHGNTTTLDRSAYRRVD